MANNLIQNSNKLAWYQLVETNTPNFPVVPIEDYRAITAFMLDTNQIFQPSTDGAHLSGANGGYYAMQYARSIDGKPFQSQYTSIYTSPDGTQAMVITNGGGVLIPNGTFTGNGGGLTNLNATNLVNGITVLPSGNVGIGTTTPATALQVVGAVTANKGFISGATNTIFTASSTGFTNGAGDLILCGVTGVGITRTNLISGQGFSYGTLTTPTDIFLTESNQLRATSGFSVLGFQSH